LSGLVWSVSILKSLVDIVDLQVENRFLEYKAGVLTTLPDLANDVPSGYGYGPRGILGIVQRFGKH
jgi:hypothetical protein